MCCASRTPISSAARRTYERDIIDNLHWLGITWDEGPQVAGGEDIGPFGPYRQSNRSELYAAEAARLLESGHAYHCWCTPEELEAVRREQEAKKEAPRYNGRCLRLTDADRAQFAAEGRQPAIRFKVPPEVVRFDDLIRGEVEFDNSLLGDFIIVRADGSPLYHFVVVIDDEKMEISHVIRGEDHISNTPKHIALIRALGYREPRFGHIPLILNADRSKMSKRKSQTSVTAYREEGYLPEAMVNFLAFLGWSPGTEEEIFTLDELIARFDLAHVHKGGAIFDKDRLDYLNGVYIRSLTDEQLALRLRPFLPDALDDEAVLRVVPLIKERLVKLADARELVAFLTEADDEVAALYDADGAGAQGALPGRRRDGAAGRPRRAGRADRGRLRGGRARGTLPGGGGAAGLEGGRLLPPAAHRHHRAQRVAAAVRLDGAAGTRSRPGPAGCRPAQGEPAGVAGMTEPGLGELLEMSLVVPIRSSTGRGGRSPARAGRSDAPRRRRGRSLPGGLHLAGCLPRVRPAGQRRDRAAGARRLRACRGGR